MMAKKRSWLARVNNTILQNVNRWSKAIRPRKYAVTTVNNNGVEVTQLVDYDTYCEEGYKRNAVVYASVREIARTAPSARLQVHRRLSRGQTEIYEESPIQKVLDMPNAHQSHYDFVELLLTYLNLDGNSYLIREREGRNTKALWLPRPDKMGPVIRRDRSIYDPDALLGYVYATQSGEKFYFLPEQVIHIKYPNPNDPYHGLGRGIPPLTAAAFDADNDNSQTQFIKQFFKNGAVASGIIKSKNILDDVEVKRIQSRMGDQYAGEQNWHKVMVLDADAEYQQTGLNMDEMVFPDLRAISETRICAAFKVPPVLIGVKSGLDAATYSNYALARRALWEDNIIPTTTKLAEALTRAFSNELEENGIILADYSNVVALQDDRTNRFARSNQAIIGGWITVNEARREVGLGPLPIGVGDVLYRPLMAEAIDDGSGDASKKVLKHQIEVVQIKSDGDTSSEIAALQDAVQPQDRIGKEREAWAKAIYKRFDRVSRAWEGKFREAARAIFEDEAKSVEAAVRSEKGASIKTIDYGEMWKAIEAWLTIHGMKQWVEKFQPLMLGLTSEQIADWAAALGINWDIENPAVAVFIKEHSYRFAEKISLTTREALRSMMNQAEDEGWSIVKMIDEVRSIYDGWSETRAELIARSETIRSSNAGQVEAYRQGGVQTEEWYATQDERLCAFCGEMHGKQMPVGGTWYTEGSEMTVGNARLLMSYGDVLYPPLHPDCRCTILPVIEE